MIIKTIGIAGVAGSGKDTLFNLFCEFLPEIPLVRRAFADFLKLDLRGIIFDRFGFDILNASREEKEIVRPMLSGYGAAQRKKTDGRYFIDKMDMYIKRDWRQGHFPVITDVRFAEFLADEPEMVKSHWNGILIHIKRRLPDGSILPPANIFEEENDPKLIKEADFHIEWPTFNQNGVNNPKETQECRSLVRNLLDSIQKDFKIWDGNE